MKLQIYNISTRYGKKNERIELLKTFFMEKLGVYRFFP